MVNPIVGLDHSDPAANTRTKVELRAAVQDSVREFTIMRRERILPDIVALHPDWTDEMVQQELDFRQPQYDEYDPVVQLAVMAADHSNSPELRRQAAGEAAQYLRPKLKSIEMVVDPLSEETRAERAELAARLVGLLEAGAAAKRAVVVDVVPRRVDDEVVVTVRGDDEESDLATPG